MHVLEIDSVIHRVSDRTLVSDVYLKLSTSDIIGLVGRNGSGKTTLMKIIFGITEPQNKFVRLNGKVIEGPLFEIKNCITYLPQTNFAPKHLTIQQFLHTYGLSSAFTNDDEEIVGPAHQKLDELSFGQRRYIEAKAVIESEARFSLLDEPFAGLAPQAIELLTNSIKGKQKDKGFLVSDHNLDVISELSTQIILMDGGTLKRDHFAQPPIV